MPVESEKFIYPKRTGLVLFVILAAACAFHANSLPKTFISDDFYIIQLNRDPFTLHSIINCLTSSDYLVLPDPTPYYRPLTRLSFILEQEFFRLTPAGYHIVSILLHAIASMLTCLTLLRLRCGLLPALLSALVFALHPINTEAVNLLAARNNILATIFILGAYLAFLHAEERSQKSGYLLSGVLFFCGVLAKETALMFLPLLFFLRTVRRMDFRKPRGILRTEVGYILPHVIFLFLYLALRHIAIDHAFHFAGLIQRLWKLIYILPKYLSLIVLPVNQSFHYVVPENLAALFWPLCFGWGVIAALIWYFLKVRNATIEFGLAWLVFNFLPISSIVPIPSAPLADRYLYIPFVGLIVILADRMQHYMAKPSARSVAISGAVAVVIAFGILSWKRNYVWQDGLALSESLVRTNPAFGLFRHQLGEEYFLLGDLDRARTELETSLKLDPTHREGAWSSYYLAAISLKQHGPLQAERHLVSAEQGGRVRPPLHFLLGSLRKNSSAQEASREYDLFLKLVMLDSSHLIPEARNGMLATDGNALPAGAPAAPPLLAPWRLYHLFPSGTRLYCAPASIGTTTDGTLQVSARYQLARRDRIPYAMKFIRFPLADLAEARYTFEINCSQHIYKTVWCTFLDKDGHLLGESNTQKEDYVKFLYPPPGSVMDGLLDSVCGGGGRQAITGSGAAGAGWTRTTTGEILKSR